MLNRLYEEGRSDKEYRTEFDDVRYERAIARLPQQERLEAIERIVYKRLFGETSTDKEDDAKNAKSAAEPKKEEAFESNDGRTSEKSVTPTVEKEKDTREAKDPAESNTAKVVAGISYRDQAAKTPPPEESKLTERQKWVNARHEAYKARYNPIAWHRMEENYKKNLPIITKRDAILDKRYIELLPMRPGGKIQQFSTYAPPTWDCKNYWSAEDGAQIKKVEQKLNVRVKSVFLKGHVFRLWPEPADWDAFEKDPAKGLELLARCEKFVEFWTWIFIGTGHVTDRVPLTTCLEWFLLGEVSPKYYEFTKLPSTSKPMTPEEASEAFKQDISGQWKNLPNAIKVQDDKLGKEKAARIKANIDSRTIAQPMIEDTFKKRVVNDEGVSKIVSKQTVIRNGLGASDSKAEVTEGNVDIEPKDGKKSYPKARQPEFNVLQVNLDGTHKITSVKDSRDVTHISKEAADKADEEYAKNGGEGPCTTPNEDAIVDADDESKDDSNHDISRGRQMFKPGQACATMFDNSPSFPRGRSQDIVYRGPWSAREESPLENISGWPQTIPNARRSSRSPQRSKSPFLLSPRRSREQAMWPQSQLTNDHSGVPLVPDDITSGVSALSLDKTAPPSNDAGNPTP
ncbi:hypothetical protein BELL_0901g00040 [Botrytis elliptica]|uniref:Uncharacterized protein n=1 Tax=Botrytis elliptica TaxID=278938 RepID=A0A4Z1J6X0_9HELO|nr:hypothetical protein BELL_0901g00040 [Botrytis elliptica]